MKPRNRGKLERDEVISCLNFHFREWGARAKRNREGGTVARQVALKQASESKRTVCRYSEINRLERAAYNDSNHKEVRLQVKR